MNVSSEIIAVLDDLCQKFGIVIDWSQKNIMPYVEDICSRIIQYEITTSIYWICLGFFISAILMIVAYLFYRYYKKCSDMEFMMLALTFGIISVFIILFVASVQTYDIITANCLPEKIILCEIKRLL